MSKRLALFIGVLVASNLQAAGWGTSGSVTYINDSGKIGINGWPSSTLDVKQENDSTRPYVDAKFYTNSSAANWHAPFFVLQRGRGTKASPASVTNGDTLGVFDFWGYTSGGGGTRSAQMQVVVDGTVGSNYVPSKINFTTVDASGNAAVRMAVTGDGLDVDGQIRAREINVNSDVTWPDYVFSEDYNLMTLSELGAFIEQESRLPGMPSASEVATNGFGVGETTTKLLEKVEELTLYVIELDKENQRLRKEVEQLTPTGTN